MAPSETAGEPHTPSTFNPDLVRLFVAFQFLGQFGLLSTVFTILFSRHVSRHVTFLNFCITWIISTICYLLLTYGGQQTGNEPDFGLCLAQAATIYGAPPMTAVSSTALVAQMWFATRTRPGIEQDRWRRVRDYVFLITPYLVFVCFVLGTGVSGASHPQAVERSRTSMYCVIRINSVGNSSAAFAVFFTIIAFVFEVLILRHVFRNWKECQYSRCLSCLCVCVAIIFIVGSSSSAPNLFLAFLPFAAWALFGTQSDIVQAWCFWKSDRFKRFTSSGKQSPAES